jgi:uncharacterized membrane protein YcaP (DUF421 family)
MKPEQYTFDLARIFLGEHPPLYYAEIALRTLVTYGYLFLLMRLSGKRGMAQMSLFDWLLVIGLGSAVGDPMFYDDVPVLHALLVITLVVGLEQLVNRLGDKFPRFGSVVDGTPMRLVRDGRLDMKSLGAESINRDEVFAALRVQGVRQLGEVERAYIEPSGRVSVLLRSEPQPGRHVLPDEDESAPPPRDGQQPTPHDGLLACFACGTTRPIRAGAQPGTCEECRAEQWLDAVLPSPKV